MKNVYIFMYISDSKLGNSLNFQKDTKTTYLGIFEICLDILYFWKMCLGAYSVFPEDKICTYDAYIRYQYRTLEMSPVLLIRSYLYFCCRHY